MKRSLLIDGGIVLASFLIGAYFYHLMPDRMPIHWGSHGPDRYGSRFEGVFTVPILMTFLVAILVSVPWLDTPNSRVTKFIRYYENGIIILPVASLIIYVQTLLSAMGPTVQIILPCAMAAVIYIVGVLLAGSENNRRVYGESHRTASAEASWWRTRLTIGIIFNFSALIALSAVFFPAYKPYLITVPVVIASVYAIIYVLSLPVKTKTGT